MRKQQAVDEKVEEVSRIIVNLEEKIAEAETNFMDVGSIKDKVFLLRRKLRLFRQVLIGYRENLPL